ncbi:MAG: redoxin domain-containing protein [Thermoleophilaceae bacterium]|nr:redoxin domain-containing protein [Thermoleophilaceae bacterium]
MTDGNTSAPATTASAAAPEGALALERGAAFPDLDLPDHTGRSRRLSELAGGDPVALIFSRGWWCPKEQRHLRELVELQDEFEVAYSRIVVVSIDPVEVQAAFRAGLGARFTFLSDADRKWLPRLGLLEATDTVHEPYQPAAFTLLPDLSVHRVYDGYWYWGRPTMEELRRDMREISRSVRADWELRRA